MTAVDGPGLSRRELRILVEIEDGLRADDRLDRAMRTMRRGPGRLLDRALGVAVRVPLAVLSVLLALSAGLLLVSPDLHATAELAAFALVWASTVVLAASRSAARRRGLRP
ncbi:hypothetical protein ABZW03_33375 [Kitasatospora sp. NPDC004799]|uniref:hypothetical protein n=1 Tax=Kitasatospora sp. NPDC004799 TaxID=3154460 RepID=UPI0033A8EEED